MKCWGKYLVQKGARNQKVQRTVAKTFASDKHMHGKGVARAGRMVRPGPRRGKLIILHDNWISALNKF